MASRLCSLRMMLVILAVGLPMLVGSIRFNRNINTPSGGGLLAGSGKLAGLIATLQDGEDWIIRRGAAKALGKLGNRAAVPPLIVAMQEDSSNYVRVEAAKALGEIGCAEAVPALLANRQAMRGLYEDFDVQEAGWVINRALGKIGTTEVVPALISSLEHGGSEAAQAYESLGMIGSADAIATLLTALSVQRDLVRRKQKYQISQGIIQGLGNTRNPTVVPVLIEVLREDSGNTEFYEDRAYAALALGKIGNPKAVSALLDVLHDDREFVWVKDAAVEALGETRDPTAVPHLNKIMQDTMAACCHSIGQKERTWQLAAIALGKIGNPEAISALLDALNTHQVGDWLKDSVVDDLQGLGYACSKHGGRVYHCRQHSETQRVDQHSS